MIQANELRIGNYIEFMNDSTSGQPQKFEVQDYSVIGRIEPIPLTEEWLLKLGFIKDDAYEKSYTSRIIRGRNIRVFHHNNATHFLLNMHFAVDLKYVHQLQNLYFALTSEELQINQ